MELLVSTGWLADEMGAADLRIIDATYFALEPERDAAADYAGGHIPGARFLDLATLADAGDARPGMLPPAEAFAARMAALGVSDGDRIVLYDNAPHLTAARAWWMFRLFGVETVALLDGGMARWRAEGRDIETGPATPPGGGHFTARKEEALVRDLAQVAANIASGAEQVIDARSAARFTGAEPDPRAGVSAGHIPGSLSLPFGRLIGPDKVWKRGAELAAEFERAGIDLDRPVVTTCGSGVTAAVLLFGLALLGKSDIALYDGSWSEWGADPATPKAVGL